MSIAVSAIVHPSRLFALALLAMGITLNVAAVMLAYDGGTMLHHALTIACALAGIGLSLFPLARKNPLRIDVSGIGQIRLVDTSPDAAADTIRTSVGEGEVVQLLRGSTFWSSLLVLRLQTRSTRVITLLIFPDSVDGETFHALSVACHWVAASHSSPAAQSADISLPAD